MSSTIFLPHVVNVKNTFIHVEDDEDWWGRPCMKAMKTEPSFSKLRTENENREAESHALSPRSRLFLDQCEVNSQRSTSASEKHAAATQKTKITSSHTSRSDLDELHSGASSPTVSGSFGRQESWYEASMLDESTFVHWESVRLAYVSKESELLVEQVCTVGTARPEQRDAASGHAEQISKADDCLVTPQSAHQGLIVPAPLRQPEASIGSALHGTGQCKPCAWFWKPEGCSNSSNCRHCHMCGKGQLKISKKIRMQARKTFENLEPRKLTALHGNLTQAVMPSNIL